jgi:Zn-dependent M16 (insulinase) family peptidase
MRPDPQLTSQELQKEKQDLKDLKKHLSQEEMEAIVDQAKKLAQYQQEEEEQSIECLPKVEISDIPAEVKDFVLKRKGNVVYHPCFTNQIVYADLVFDLPEITEADFPYVQILSSFLSELGAGKRNYVENLEYLQAYTAGVMGGFSLNPHVDNVQELSPFLMIRGKALNRHASSLFSVMKEMVTSFRLDEKRRIEELMLQMYANLENRLNRNALRYANQLALSGFSSVGKVNYLCHGLSFFKTVQEIVESFSHKGLDVFIERLSAVRDKIFTFCNPRLILSCDDAMAGQLEREKYFGILDLPTKASHVWKGNLSLSEPPSQGIPIASPLAFNCLAYQVSPYLHPHAPALSLGSRLIDNRILHPLIREQGGAYGCGATYGAATGYFTFHSYRDPHVANTLKIFEQSIEAIANGDFDREI